MELKEQYKEIMSEIILKQAVILGPEMAVMRARGVVGLTVSDEGRVTELEGDEKALLQKLIDVYVELSGEIVKNALSTVFSKYPDVITGID